MTVGMLLADARLPSGGHVSSSGLEPALLGGLPPEEAAEYMIDRARTAATVDAGTAVVTRHRLALGREEIHDVELAWAARTPGAAARQIARELGRGLQRLAGSLWPDAALGQPGQLGQPGASLPRPLVLGAIAAHTGLPATDLARLVIYDDAASAAAALLKLEPGDPARAMSMALRACAAVEPEIAGLAELTEPHEIPSISAPRSEDWIERHAHTPRRLFRA